VFLAAKPVLFLAAKPVLPAIAGQVSLRDSQRRDLSRFSFILMTWLDVSVEDQSGL
jgi:hypothetical protein